MQFCQDLKLAFSIFLSSTKICPWSAFSSPSIMSTKVVLPLPVLPAIPIEVPAGINKFIFSSAFFVAVEYL